MPTGRLGRRFGPMSLLAAAGVLMVTATQLVIPATARAAPTCAGAGTSPATGLVPQAHPVVLVHGWAGTVLSDTRTHLERRMTPGWQFLLFDYHDASVQWASSPDIADCLGQYILDVSEAHRSAGGDGFVYIVGHSMGGLAARFATNTPTGLEGVGQQVGGLVTLDTPHAGSPWGNSPPFPQVAEFAAGFALNPVPPDRSPARVCLAAHQGGRGLPAGCEVAPYLPSTVPIHQVGGLATVRRTFFGMPAYDIPLGGDSIVNLASQHGYLGSSPGDRPGYSRNKVSTTTVDCARDDSALLAEAAARSRNVYIALLGALAQAKSDSAALDAVLSGSVNANLAYLLLVANATLSCSHVGIKTDAEALDAVEQALREQAAAKEAPDLDISALASAEVPSLCDHPPGRLVDGQLPGIPETNGFVSLDLSERLPVAADFDSDGATEIVAIADCSQGGVGWPNSLLLYGPGPRLLDEFNVGQIVDRGLQDYAGDRSGVRAMEERDGKLHVAWLVHRDGDFGAGPTLPVEAALDVVDEEFTVVDVIRRDERSTLEAIIAAANGKDRSALERHDLGQYVTDDLIAAVEVGGSFTGFECAGATDTFDYDWVRDNASRSCQLTQSDGYVAYAYFVLSLDTGNAFRSNWRLDAFDAPVLYGD